jgi:hypothetical protein
MRFWNIALAASLPKKEIRPFLFLAKLNNRFPCQGQSLFLLLITLAAVWYIF